MSIGRIDIIAGDFEFGNASQFVRGDFLMKNTGSFSREKINIKESAGFEEITQENVTSFSGAAGGGLVGGVLLGPAGMLAGLVLGGKRDNVTFHFKFKDGREFIGTSSAKTFNLMKHALLASGLDRSDENKAKNLKKTNKLLHIILSVITFGLWLPIWLLLIAKNYAHNNKYKN